MEHPIETILLIILIPLLIGMFRIWAYDFSIWKKHDQKWISLFFLIFGSWVYSIFYFRKAVKLGWE